MRKLLIKNIKGLCQVRETSDLLRGTSMNELPILENAWLAIEDGLIAAYGSMSDWGGISDWCDLKVIDADGKYVLPAWCDSHTHIVYADSREQEFTDRIAGLTYEEIAARGGGILNSVQKLRDADEDFLFANAMERIHHVAELGTGAIEIKSGYGLSLDAELKMLRVAKRIEESTHLTVKKTLLAAHAYPLEFQDNKGGYVEHIIKDIIPAAVAEDLADYIDVFCEANYFSVEDTVKIIEAASEQGLPAKIHVNQFNAIGGIQACVDNNALSVDHLEVMAEEDFVALEGGSTIATLLPSCSFFINIPYAPVREMITRNIPVALATDFNPGSTPSGNIPLMLSMAAVNMGMTLNECINAVTLNAAYAMGLGETHGSITPGKVANLVVTKPMKSLDYLLYSFGENHIESVILEGNETVDH